MKVGKMIAWIGLFAMTAVLLNGFINGSFTADGAALLANPWGIVSLIDLYVGFALFSMWIAFREKNKVLMVGWIAAMMVFGFFAGSLYVLVVFYQSKGDWLAFFLGSRKTDILGK